MIGFEPGLSIIVPTYKGIRTLPELLNSLEMQSIDKELYEVIFVLNGSDDGTEAFLRDFCTRHPSMNIRFAKSSQSGAGRARNIGISLARFEYMTFVDDDDSLARKFIETGLEFASQHSCVALPMLDIRDGGVNETTAINLRLKSLSGATIALSSVPWILGYNAAKIVPSRILKKYRYQEDLLSGEDVVFFAQLLQEPSIEIRIPNVDHTSAYLRSVRDGSVSRQERSFDFNVKQRIQVIAKLQEVNVDPDGDAAIEFLKSAQFGFVLDYLRDFPDDVPKAQLLARLSEIEGLSWDGLRDGVVSKAVFSYCFPPFNDPSGNVAAKRIRNEQEIVDVFAADLTGVRDIDNSLLQIGEPFVNSIKRIKATPSFSDWRFILEFGKKAAKEAENRLRKGISYSSLYSRALWSGSHVAAALFKLEHPELSWTAEFSDPMIRDASGNLRHGRCSRDFVTRKLIKIVSQYLGTEYKPNSHFELVQFVTFALADEIIFTNEHQKNAMLHDTPKEIAALVEPKSTISPHPLPDSDLYKTGRELNLVIPGRINLAYFGSFYGNRGLGNLGKALAGLSEKEKMDLALHIFTNSAVGSAEALSNEGFPLYVHEPLPYLDYLKCLGDFDVLIVADAITDDSAYERNPFLPSKYSDYAGAGTPIWGLVEQGSTLDSMPLAYKDDIKSTLVELQDRLREILHKAS